MGTGACSSVRVCKCVCVCVYIQVERLHSELSLAREEVSRKVALVADNADAMLSNAAGTHTHMDAHTHRRAFVILHWHTALSSKYAFLCTRALVYMCVFVCVYRCVGYAREGGSAPAGCSGAS